MMNSKFSRRAFVAGGLASAALAASPGPTAASVANGPANRICAFTKFLDTMSYESMAETIARLGFDGIEATVRPRGQVLPERAEEDLPKLVEALQQHDLEITLMTTTVSRADQPADEKLLRLAAGLGVKRYRMGYYTYDVNKPIKPQWQSLRSVVRDVAAMNGEIGIQGLYQNHAGARYVGATIWDFWSFIDEIPVEQIGFAFDIRHAMVEAGLAWPVVQNLVEPHLGAVCVKDFVWDNGRAAHVPLGEGRVDPGFVHRLHKMPFRGPYSLHVEYLPREGVQPNIDALGRDLTVLRQWLAAGS